MDYVNLGKAGIKVSRICVGCMSFGAPEWRPWVLPEEESRDVIKHALELGVNFFDTADVYSQGVSEQVTGRALKDFARRDQIVLATKVGLPVGEGPLDRGLSRKRIMQSIDASLRRLQTDYVDLYQIHRWDYDTPIEETLGALNDVVSSGKARYVGASSMFAWQFTKAQYVADLHGWRRFVSMQNHYNLVYREEEREMNPFCNNQGIALLPWSPLARGMLAGNRNHGENGATTRSRTDAFKRELYCREENQEIANRVEEVATRRGLGPAQVALGWLLSKPAVCSPIIGATKVCHIDQAVQAIQVKLSTEEIRFLEEAYSPHPIQGYS
jgi:1-deoxyxylulose-5-phosphate synthase